METWSPQSKKNIRLIESIQRRATKLVPELTELPYEERLRRLKLPSLVYRRNRGDMIQAFKYTNKIWDVSDSPLKLSKETRTRGHTHKLHKGRWITAVRGEFFTNRVINLWNSLPEDLVKSKDTKSFKIGLDNLWSTKSWLYDFESGL